MSSLRHSNQRIAKIAAFVKDRLEQKSREFPHDLHDPVYRWEHTRRVANYGRVLAEAEGAETEIVITACLLHDVAHFESDDDYKDHGRRGARIARPVLIELGYTPEQVENICFSVAAHVDGEADFEHPNTIEARCVTDADNIDRFGAFRILQWCVPEMKDFPRLIEKLILRLERLQDYRSRAMVLDTVTGDRIFKQRLDQQIEFFQALIEEYEITTLSLVEES